MRYSSGLSFLLSCVLSLLNPGIFAAETDFDYIRGFSREELSAGYDFLSLFNGVNDEGPCFFASTKENVNGLAVVAHGLNVRPSMMGNPYREGTLVKLLLDAGFHTARITLRGHGGSLEEMKTLTLKQWLGDAYVQYAGACMKAFETEGKKLPVYLVGFSLGALVFEELANEETGIPVRFEKAVLFSPALAVKSRARSLLLLNPLLRDTSIINSVSPAEYRAQRGASLGAYKALFELEKRLYAKRFANNNIPTLVVMDPDDELVSLKSLRETLRKFGLSNWSIQEVSASGSKLEPKYHHLIIDDNCVDTNTWKEICRGLTSFLEQGN